VNWSVLRKEWGAVTFVVTVLVGIIVVPLALYFTQQGPAAIAAPPVATASAARASSAEVASPARVSPTP
jgi:FtsH-binding integral membrane protein